MRRGGLKKRLNKKLDWKTLILSFFIVYATALAGSIFTSPGVKSFWYQTVRPSITPPDLVFPIVWNILFFMIFVSLYLSLTNSRNKHVQSKIEIVFGINLVLNFLWSVLYFGLRNPLLAFIDLILLAFSIASIIFIVRKINRKAAWLLAPYLIWVCFAGILNYLSIFK
jgi:tryptophan-rich sensory protein